jgi:hypothetical protein
VSMCSQELKRRSPTLGSLFGLEPFLAFLMGWRHAAPCQRPSVNLVASRAGEAIANLRSVADGDWNHIPCHSLHVQRRTVGHDGHQGLQRDARGPGPTPSSVRMPTRRGEPRRAATICQQPSARR